MVQLLQLRVTLKSPLLAPVPDRLRRDALPYQRPTTILNAVRSVRRTFTQCQSHVVDVMASLGHLGGLTALLLAGGSIFGRRPHGVDLRPE